MKLPLTGEQKRDIAYHLNSNECTNSINYLLETLIKVMGQDVLRANNENNYQSLIQEKLKYEGAIKLHSLFNKARNELVKQDNQ